jgi:hypothetical protein
MPDIPAEHAAHIAADPGPDKLLLDDRATQESALRELSRRQQPFPKQVGKNPRVENFALDFNPSTNVTFALTFF